MTRARLRARWGDLTPETQTFALWLACIVVLAVGVVLVAVT